MKITFISILILASSLVSMSQNAVIPKNRQFIIQSAMNFGRNTGGCWDIPGGKNPRLKNGKNVEVWEYNGGCDQHFSLVSSSMPGYYEIITCRNYSYRVNVDGGRTNNGTNVELWSNNSNRRQNFRFKHLGNGRFKIYTTTNRVLCLNGRRNKNGTNIHIWQDHNGSWMEWYLLDPVTRKPFIPGGNTKISKNTGSTLYNLKYGEEFVYGKTGLTDNGDIKYNLIVVRKKNTYKKIYRDSYKEYDIHSIQGSSRLTIDKNPKDYQRYDYYVVFNGKRMGPYDGIIEPHQADPRVDKWVSEDGKTISFAGQKEDYYRAIIHNKDQQKFYGPGQAPYFDPQHKSESYTMRWKKGDYRFIDNTGHKLTNWWNISTFRSSGNGNVAYIGSKNRNEYNVYLNHRKIHGPIKYDSRSLGMKIYYDTNPQLGLKDKNDIMFANKELIFRVTNMDNSTTVKLGRETLNFPSNLRVSNLYKKKGHLVFFVSDKQGNTSVYKYNIARKYNRKLGDYKGYVRFNSYDKNDTDFVYTKDNERIIFGFNGLTKHTYKYNKNEKKVRYKVSPRGDVYKYYTKGYKEVTKILKNGNSFINNYFSYMNDIKFLPQSGEAVIIASNDRVKPHKYYLYIGDQKHTANKGYILQSISKSGRKVFTSQAIGNTKKSIIQINGKACTNNRFETINSFCTTKSGSKYAFMTNADGKKFKYFNLHELHIANLSLMPNKKMVVNGNILSGRYGTPVYVPKKDKIVAIKQDGSRLKLIEL